MTEIKIYQNTSSNKISDLYTEYICGTPTHNVTLIIPSEITKYRFGLLADLLKLVITLNSKFQISILRIDIDKENIRKLYDQEFAYPIISLLWNTAKFLDKSNNDIKDLLRDLQNEYFNKMNSLESLKGRKYILSNTDHLSQNKGLIKFLENSNGFNDDENYITGNIKKILDKNILVFNQQNSNELNNIIDDIGSIVYELSKNTFEWGRSDAKMMKIPSSIRGIYFRFNSNNILKLKEEFENTPIINFLNHKYINENCVNDLMNIYYLEILVYDSGIGYIDKFGDKENLSDIDIIKKCLVKNQTSSKSNLEFKKGLGLDRMLQILDKKGFLRIMTDKYNIYRDLIKDPHIVTPLNKLENLKLDDWNENHFASDINSKCQGSYISILYPFKKAELNE